MQQGPLFPPENPYAAPGVPPYGGYDQPPPQWGAGMPAGFWVRFGARLVDGVVTAIVAFVIGFTLALAGLVHVHTRHSGDPLSVLADAYAPGKLAASVAAGLSYNILSEVMTGATIGKMMFGLRVKSENGGPVTFVGALLRNLLYYVDAFFCGIVGYAFMSKSPLQQRLGDKAGKAVVVTKSSMEAAGNPMGIVLGLVGYIAFAVLNLYLST